MMVSFEIHYHTWQQIEASTSLDEARASGNDAAISRLFEQQEHEVNSPMKKVRDYQGTKAVCLCHHHDDTISNVVS